MVAVVLGSDGRAPESKTFKIRARQYAYDPPVIRVHQGDTVHIRLSSADVVHGFYLEAHGIDAEIYPLKKTFLLKDDARPERFREVSEVVVVAENTGKFRYRCSHTCGYMHPFMQGEFVVEPNHPYHAATGAAIGLLLAGGWLLSLRARKILLED